ncbi:hypothetical protein Tco_1247137 [Tanacetum coccineum]
MKTTLCRCLQNADEAGKSKSSSEVVTKEASAEIGKEKMPDQEEQFFTKKMEPVEPPSAPSTKMTVKKGWRNDGEETGPMKKANTNSDRVPLFAMEVRGHKVYCKISSNLKKEVAQMFRLEGANFTANLNTRTVLKYALAFASAAMDLFPRNEKIRLKDLVDFLPAS